MIVVRIEVWPFGNRSRRREIGTLVIANDATGDPEVGHYNAALSHGGDNVQKPGCWKAGRIEGHLRKLSPYHLVLKAIAACLEGKRNQWGDQIIRGVRAADRMQEIVDTAKLPKEL